MNEFKIIDRSKSINNEFSLTVISGKGGTGKTSITSSLAYLFNKDIVKADCDVDASNLGIILEGETISKKDYKGAKVANVYYDICIGCGKCKEVCRYDAIDIKKNNAFINELKCEGCNACVVKCPLDAIKLKDEITGIILKKRSDSGVLVTSKMIPGAEGSGKLVTEVKKLGKKESLDLLIDGSPGIGCAVMASVTGSKYSLIVTEPTKSGLEDMKRVFSIVENFNSRAFAVINKYDINENMSLKIEEECENLGIDIVGKIPFDTTVNKAINNLKPIIYYRKSKAAKAIIEMYNSLMEKINS